MGNKIPGLKVSAGLAEDPETAVLGCRITLHCTGEPSRHRHDASQLCAGFPPGSGITYPKAPHSKEISVNLNYLCQEIEGKIMLKRET